MAAVREVKTSHVEGAAPRARSRALLSLDEVRAIDLPAYFYDDSEELLYLDGELFDLRDSRPVYRDSSCRKTPR